MNYSVILSKSTGNTNLCKSVSPLVIQAYFQTQLKRDINLDSITSCSTIVNRTGKMRLHIVRN